MTDSPALPPFGPEPHPADRLERPATAPLVSVCIPTYNSAPFVAETVDSILRQTYPHLEIVIGDHGSSDTTWAALQRYASDPRIRLLRPERGGGAQANWNRVTEAARGVYVKVVCADDPIYPTCIARQVEVMEQNPSVVLVASKRDIVDAHGRMLYRGRGLGSLNGRVPGHVAIRSAVRAGTNIFGEPSSVLIRSDALRAAGAWSDELAYLTDEDMYIRLLARGDLFALPEPLAAFRLSMGSWSVTLARKQARQSMDFHRMLRRTYPGIVTAADGRLGVFRAFVNAWARRLVYATHRARLTVSPT